MTEVSETPVGTDSNFDAKGFVEKVRNGEVQRDITQEERQACLPYLILEENKSQYECADLFGVCQQQISYDWRQLRDKWSEKLEQITNSELASEIWETGKRDAAQLRKQEKYDAANRVLKRTIDALLDLDIVDKQAQEMNVNWVDELEDI